MSKKFLVGIDIGGTSIKMAVFEDDGTIIDKWEIPTNKDNQGVSIPGDIWTSLENKLKEHSIDPKEVQGMGVGAPGFIDSDTGSIYEAVNIGWKKNFDLGKQLQALSGLPVFVDNDANLAALGENWKGAGNLAENLIAITIGTGVGGGIITNGQVVNGSNGTAGEIGHIMVEADGYACNCGRKGCLETVTSATGMVRQAKEKLKDNPNSLLKTPLEKNGDLTTKDIFDAAKEGDAFSISIIERVADVLGLAIANVATIVNPSKIVIGGGVSKAGDQLLIPLRKAFDSFCLPRISEACEFRIAQLGNDAGVVGAAYLVKQKLS
ncbi:ROK family glucokinase [Radiobacillus kanasensis]|uniref:ROK family glucokinase n=1 Tax=Radiobacillus kanasensis TaxID=2844358 RepID=UPI001E5E6DB4|nr:ROK family glucokinase [Radiobacillus kanasensis]UFT97776.1 ROK family glucokinase [Radiobacillus kanasensis]